MKIFSYLLAVAGSSNHQEKRKIESTVASRLINPELYIKPNKHVMNFGVAAIAGCFLYIVYMVSTSDSKGSKKEKTFSIQTGKISTKNKWD